jgi:hypothetical protein
MQFIFRFIVGGVIVSLFAGLGGILKPKSFAGLFGAAPSVARVIWGLPKHRLFFRRRSGSRCSQWDQGCADSPGWL